MGGHIMEGQWLGVNEQSKGFHIYWPDTRMVTTERNVYYDKMCLSACCLEGEDWEFMQTIPNSPVKALDPQDPVIQSQPVIPL